MSHIILNPQIIAFKLEYRQNTLKPHLACYYINTDFPWASLFQPAFWGGVVEMGDGILNRYSSSSLTLVGK